MANDIPTATQSSFRSICNEICESYPIDGYQRYYESLSRGEAILTTPEQCETYLACYGDMHRIKLELALDCLFREKDLAGKTMGVVDWGSGQATASCVLVDKIRETGFEVSISSFILIEPSAVALQTGSSYLKKIMSGQDVPPVHLVNQKADEQLNLNFRQDVPDINIHLLSNLLDISTVDITALHKNVLDNFKGLNYFLCISPYNTNRLVAFSRLFEGCQILSTKTNSILAPVFRPRTMAWVPMNVSRAEIIFKTTL